MTNGKTEAGNRSSARRSRWERPLRGQEGVKGQRHGQRRREAKREQQSKLGQRQCITARGETPDNGEAVSIPDNEAGHGLAQRWAPMEQACRQTKKTIMLHNSRKHSRKFITLS